MRVSFGVLLKKDAVYYIGGPYKGTLITIHEANYASDIIIRLLLWLLLCYHDHHGHDDYCSCRYCDQGHNALSVLTSTSFTGRRGLDQTDRALGYRFGVLLRASKWKKTRMWGAVLVSRRVGGWARGAVGDPLNPKPLNP